MDTDEVFRRCAALRVRTADVIDSLTESQLAAPSPCGGWDVRTVAAHLTVLPTVSLPRFAAAMIRARGNFDRANDVVSRELARRPVAGLSAALREHAASRAVPPRGGARAPLADLLVHGADICRPTGQTWDPDAAEVEVALDFLAGEPMGFSARGRLSGLRLVAEDLGRSWRDGAEIRGPGAELMLAVCGRAGSLPALRGPGVEILADRIGAGR